MTCAACARTIERTLANTAGVEHARVNLATNTATVDYQPKRVQVADFIAAIEDLGYGVPKTETRSDSAEPPYRRRTLPKRKPLAKLSTPTTSKPRPTSRMQQCFSTNVLDKPTAALQ